MVEKQLLSVPCPVCGAPKGQNCVSKRLDTKLPITWDEAVHNQRRKKASKQ